jgi:hypothetical protein
MVFCFRLDSKVSEAFVRIVVADTILEVDSDECRRPTIAMGQMIAMDIGYRLYHLFPANVA